MDERFISLSISHHVFVRALLCVFLFACTRARMGMGGELPPLLSQTCGSLLNGTLYVFGGRDNDTYTNQVSVFTRCGVSTTLKQHS